MSAGIKLENIWHILPKQRTESQSIAAICDAQSNCAYDNKLINDTLLTLYCKLYTSEQPNEVFDGLFLISTCLLYQ